MFVNLNSILPKARKEHYAVPAFDCVADIMVRTILDTAEEQRSPVILMALDHDLTGKGMAFISTLITGIADQYTVPVCLHLDHATDLTLIQSALDHGFSSVMYDGSALPFKENIINTARVVEMAKSYNAAVEAELGLVAGTDIHGTASSSASQLTDPNDVVEFIEKTGIDALAVSIGTSHGVYIAKPNLDIERLMEINEISSVPLVLHGGSGTPGDQVREAIKHGMAKINIYADLRFAMFAGVKEAAAKISRQDPLPDQMFEPIQKNLSNIVVEKMQSFHSSGRV